MLGTRKRVGLRPVEKLTGAYARSFIGGLNTLDSPLNLNSKFLTECRNLFPDAAGTLRVRYGTSLYADLSQYAGVPAATIVACEYYIDQVICVLSNGKVVSVNSDGVTLLIFDTAIAGALPGAPAAWTNPTVFASFAQFNGKLLICNGVDKPLIVDGTTGTPTVNYLADLGSASNVNTQRAKFVVTHNGYTVMAVTPTNRTMLYISSKGTSGTYVGDPGPNDAVNFDTSLFITRGLTDITGLATFRDKLIVTFDEAIMVMTLGEYTGDDHIPRVDEVIENYGAVSHRTIVPMGDDILFMDKVGIASVARALMTRSFSPNRESTLVGLDIQKVLSRFSVNELNNALFAVHDRIQSQVLFFLPKETAVEPTPVVPPPLIGWSSTDKSAQMTITGSNRIATVVGGGVIDNWVRADYGISAGKRYFQLKLGSANGAQVGVALLTATGANLCDDIVGGVGIWSSFATLNGGVIGSKEFSVSTANKIVEFCVDRPNNLIWMRIANYDGSSPTTWNDDGSANPATGVGGLNYSVLGAGTLYPIFAGATLLNNNSCELIPGPTFDVLGPPTGFEAMQETIDEDAYVPPAQVPSGSDNHVYVFCTDKSQRFRAMAYYDTMPYRCGCRTSDGRIILGTGTRLWYYRNQFEPLHIDFAIPDDQPWDDGLDWDDNFGWYEEGLFGTYSGQNITFSMATPWSDMKEPEKIKEGRYLHAVFEGSGQVTVEQYNDRFAMPVLNHTLTQTEQPATPDQAWRPANNDQLYAWNSKFSRAKMRVYGNTSQPLRVLSIGLMYLPGGYRR